MNNYETIVILRPDLSVSQVDSLIDRMLEVLKEAGANLARRENWGVRAIAYRIRKHRKGHYILLNYAVAATARVEMERRLGISEDVLRFMTVKTDDLPTGPSVMLQKDRARHDQGENE